MSMNGLKLHRIIAVIEMDAPMPEAQAVIDKLRDSVDGTPFVRANFVLQSRAEGMPAWSPAPLILPGDKP